MIDCSSKQPCNKQDNDNLKGQCCKIKPFRMRGLESPKGVDFATMTSSLHSVSYILVLWMCDDLLKYVNTIDQIT